MPRTLLLALLVLFASATSFALEIPFVGNWSLGGESNEEEVRKTQRVGGREWWRKNKDKAEFVVGKGYRVAGVEGYFDGSGVPINASVDEQAIQLDRSQQEQGGLLPGLDPRKAATRFRENAGFGPDQEVAEGLFKEGLTEFQAGKYKSAAFTFESAATRWPGTDLAAKSLFNAGESHFHADNYKQSSESFIELLDKHPSTPKLDEAVERLWEIARYWEKTYFNDDWHAPFDYRPFAQTVPKTDTIGNAIRLYEAIRLNDPTGPRADDAIMATAGIYFTRKRFADADYHYTLLREEYPRSEHQFEAHLLGLQAKMNRYHGADYDGSPLQEARRLEEMTRANFSGRLSDEERERLRAVRAQVARATEERDLRMAQYYEGTEHIASAKYYLTRVAEEYADSPSAEQAKQRLLALEGKPDRPDVPMEWMVNWFPENKKFESINSVKELAPTTPGLQVGPDGGRTMVAEAPGDPATTR